MYFWCVDRSFVSRSLRINLPIRVVTFIVYNVHHWEGTRRSSERGQMFVEPPAPLPSFSPSWRSPSVLHLGGHSLPVLWPFPSGIFAYSEGLYHSLISPAVIIAHLLLISHFPIFFSSCLRWSLQFPNKRKAEGKRKQFKNKFAYIHSLAFFILKVYIHSLAFFIPTSQFLLHSLALLAVLPNAIF